VLPLIRPGIRPKKIHLLVEEVRPRGISAALRAAECLGKDKERSIDALEKIITNTAARNIPVETAKSLINEEDLELIYILLMAVYQSGSYLRWGEGKKFV